MGIEFSFSARSFVPHKIQFSLSLETKEQKENFSTDAKQKTKEKTAGYKKCSD